MFHPCYFTPFEIPCPSFNGPAHLYIYRYDRYLSYLTCTVRASEFRQQTLHLSCLQRVALPVGLIENEARLCLFVIKHVLQDTKEKKGLLLLATTAASGRLRRRLLNGVGDDDDPVQLLSLLSRYT